MKSIRGKLLVSFGLALLVLLSIPAVVTYLQVRDTVVPLTRELSIEILQARSAEMSRLMDGYSAEVRTVSQLQVLRQGDFATIADYLTGISEQINPHYEMIFFADREGNFITTNNLQGNIGDREYFRQIIHGEADHFVSDPMISRSTGEEIFVVAWAVFGPTGEKRGVLASTVLLDTLSGIAAAISIGQHGFGYIVDRTGLLIAHPREDLRMKLNFIDSQRLGYTGLTEVGRAMAEGRSGVMSYSRPGGETLITAFNAIPHTQGWSLGVALLEEELMGRAHQLMRHIALTMGAIILGVLLMVYLLSDRISRPITVLTEGVRTVSCGNLECTLEIKTGDEIEDLAEAYNKMTANLKEHIRNLQQTTAEKERIESELQVANKIQSSMLPRTFPPYPEIDNLNLYAMMDPAREVGGDFYDFFAIDNRRFCFSIGDVSGKGIPAALFMVITRTIMKNQALQGYSLDAVFERTNELLCSENVENMFATVFMGILDTQRREIEYVCAGHNPPLISRQGAPYRFLDVQRNLVLGGMDGFQYQVQRLTVEAGDLLFLYTDGVNEAMNGDGELFGNDRMIAAVNRTAGAAGVAHASVASDTSRARSTPRAGGIAVRKVIESVRQAVSDFVEETPASDDLTMLALTLTG